jgi:hypothetical protein
LPKYYTIFIKLSGFPLALDLTFFASRYFNPSETAFVISGFD